jgi:ABC-type polysaccharide/polyol phosphate transport system ATPase subunit
MIERNPDYRTTILEIFQNLKELDSVPITESLKQQVRLGTSLKREIMPFFYRMDKLISVLDTQVQHADLRKIYNLKEKYEMIFQLKHLSSFKTITPKILLGHLEVINSQILEKYKQDYQYMPENRQELYYLFKWLF